MNQVKWKPLLISLAVSLGVGAVSGLVTADSMSTYETIYRPPLAPPGWLFPVVWTILYALMGIAAYLISQTEHEKKGRAFKLYFAQLLVNAIWPVLFFHFHAYFLAFAWLLILWYLVFLMTRQFSEISPLAGKLLLPYLVWVTFAGYLNLAIAVYSFTH